MKKKTTGLRRVSNLSRVYKIEKKEAEEEGTQISEMLHLQILATT